MATSKKIASPTAARISAARVLQEHCVGQLPVDPFAIARACDIIVEPKPSSNGGFSGMLARVGDTFGILYATHVPSLGFQRFSVGHELGHYFLEGHVDQLLATGPHASRSGFIARDPYEIEADLFASALLLPPKLVGPALRDLPDGLAGIQGLAKLGQTSLTATAIAYVQQTTEAAAVIQSHKGVVEFCTMSEAMKDGGARWLRSGDLIPSGVLTAKITDPEAVCDVLSARIGLAPWFECSRDHAAEEQVIGLGSFGRLLSLVRCDRLSLWAGGYDDEDESEADLIAQWTPRFK